MKKLRGFYDANDIDKFYEDFIWYLSLPISGLTERSAYIDRTLGNYLNIYKKSAIFTGTKLVCYLTINPYFPDFVAKFACSFLEKPKTGEESTDNSQMEEEEEELPPFLYRWRDLPSDIDNTSCG